GLPPAEAAEAIVIVELVVEVVIAELVVVELCTVVDEALSPVPLPPAPPAPPVPARNSLPHPAPMLTSATAAAPRTRQERRFSMSVQDNAKLYRNPARSPKPPVSARGGAPALMCSRG